MQRGEVDALVVPWTVLRVAHADWLRDHKINILLQPGVERAADLADTPRVIDMARNDEQRQILEMFSLSEQIGRSFVAPPGTPPERVRELRTAIAATLDDAGLRAEIATLHLSLDPMSGEALQKLIASAFRYGPARVVKHRRWPNWISRED